MGAMQVTMIDENKYAETMTDVVLPALEQCCEEGWFDPSAAERSAGIEPLSGIMDTGGRSGQLHYLCYDSAKFDAIREQGATATFRGAIVISHGFTEFADMLMTAANAPLPLILVLDQVQDPGNAGTLARTLYAMGGAGLVIPRHNGTFLGAGARRAAAGALERLPVSKVMNVARALDEARDAGFLIYGAAFGEGSLDARLHPPALLVLGNEEHGIRPQVAKRCHHLLHIPMLRAFDSLNVAQAGGILTSCFARQHLEKNPSGE